VRKLVAHMPIADSRLMGRHRIAAGGQCEPIDGVDEPGIWEIDDALVGGGEVAARLRASRDPEHRAVPEPEDRGDRGEVLLPLLIEGADQGDGSAEVENGGVDGDGGAGHGWRPSVATG